MRHKKFACVTKSHLPFRAFVQPPWLHVGLFKWGPLRTFEAAYCNISGQLPELLGASAATTTLQMVAVQGNTLSGTIPGSWVSFTNMACLQLTHNPGMCGRIPDNLPCFDTLGTALGEVEVVSIWLPNQNGKHKVFKPCCTV